MSAPVEETSRKEPTDLDVRTFMSRRLAGPPAVAGLIRHAEKYGIDGVAESAAEFGLNEEQLTDLIVKLDGINAAFRRDPKRKALHYTPPKSAPADPGKRARLLLGIPEPEPLTKPSPDGDPPAGKVGGRPKKEGAREGAKRGSGARAGRPGAARDG